MKLKRKLKKRILKYSLFLCIIFFILFSFKFFNKKGDIISLKSEYIPITTENKSLILKHETVIKSLNAGEFLPRVDEFSRVRNGQIIGSIKVDSFNNEIYHNNNNNEYFIDEDYLLEQKDEIYKDLKNAIKNSDYINAGKIKEDLINKLYRIKKINEMKSINAHGLENNKVGKEDAYTGQQINLYAIKNGIISFLIDDFENTLTYDNRYSIDYDNIWNTSIQNYDSREHNIKKNQPIYKIINPIPWYLACKISKEDINFYKNSSKVFVQYNDEKIEAIIEETFDLKNTAILILKLDKTFSDFYKKRKIDIKIIQDEVKGIFIPNESIVKKNHQIGVYYINIENRLKFIPVFAIKTLDDGIIVKENEFKTEDDNIVETVRRGYNIVNNAKKYKEDEIIDLKSGGAK